MRRGSRQTQRPASEPPGPTVAADDAPTSCLGDNGTASLPWALSTATCSAQVRRPASRPSFPTPSQPQRPTPRCRQICAGTTSSCSNFPGGSVHFRLFPLEKISPAPGNRIPIQQPRDHRCLGPLATASWAPEEAPATRRYRVFPHESCRYPNCVRQPRHSPATRLPPLRRCRRQMRPQQPACAQLSSTVRRTTSSVPAAANSSQPRTVAGVQRPAVRLDRRDDIPLEPLIEPLGRRLVGHRQHLGSRSWPQGQETCCAKANRTGGCALEDLPRSVTRNRSRRGSSNGR